MSGVGASRYSATMPLAVGFTAVALLAGGLGVWSVTTRIAGAVIASGVIVVENNRQVVQHAEGGVVGRILARDGDRVAGGASLLRLDGTLLRSELSIAQTQMAEIRARKARLEAERSDAPTPVFPPALLAAARSDAAVREQVEGQRTLFDARRETRAREMSQIDESMRQTRNQIVGTRAQLTALGTQKRLIEEELADQESLLEKGLVPVQRVLSLRREAARLEGDIGRLTAEIARFRGAIAAFEIEKLKRETSRREDAIAALRDIQFRELELIEQSAALEERISRLDLRAPVAGVVYGSTVFAEQSVVRAAEPVMYVVPQDRPLVVSARVGAIDVDQVHVGQEAMLRFTSFNQRLTPEIRGRVTDVSADVFEDEATGIAYYRIRLVPLAGDIAQLQALDLVPGMPVEAFLRTTDRTPLSYLTKPLADYFGRAMRES